MMLFVVLYVLLALLSTKANAETKPESQWPIDLPWQQPDNEPPEVQLFELPTLKGKSPDFHTAIPALQNAPKANPDQIYQVITRCYPEKTKFKIDVNLVAGMRSSIDQYDSSDWPSITDHYIGIVGEMPLYSTTEQAREREWEHKRRVGTAKQVADFVQALANRNHAYREMGIYLAMEARSQARVKQGIANITEQIGFLEKVATAQRDILKYEAQVIENRLALISMCDNDSSKHVNTYLKKIAYLPPPQPKTDKPQ
ncbi:hypothetical protein [Photobacterium kishitanii]|uniref:hypothetical protein n=1 Tax=Photobacterium kishitanii TaxID=318456 RepID=UPI0007F8A3B0|nr:hypothetical protein [Photobacterium kishitanii]OBU30167.1 hypothetical protein AYY23_21840 [Photobacterium kishitanii]PSW46805.1 hypothetical protein C0W66_21615 [Photobacterium kishitanii]